MEDLSAKLEETLDSLLENSTEEQRAEFEPVVARSRSLLKDIKSSPFDEGIPSDVWVARVVFISYIRWLEEHSKGGKRNAQNDAGVAKSLCFSLTDILNAAGISLHNFTMDLNVFSSSLGLAGKEVTLIKEYVSSYVITSHAVHKFKEFFGEFFKMTTEKRRETPASRTPRRRVASKADLTYPEMKELPMLSFGWQLYINYLNESSNRSHLYSFKALVCVINFMISISPKAFLNEKGLVIRDKMHKGKKTAADAIEDFSQTYRYKLSEAIVSDIKAVAEALSQYLERVFDIPQKIPSKPTPQKNIISLLSRFDKEYAESLLRQPVPKFDDRLYIFSSESYRSQVIGAYVGGIHQPAQSQPPYQQHSQIQRQQPRPDGRSAGASYSGGNGGGVMGTPVSQMVAYPQTPVAARTPDSRVNKPSPLRNKMQFRIESPYEQKINAQTWINTKIGSLNEVSGYKKVVEDFLRLSSIDGSAIEKSLNTLTKSNELEAAFGTDLPSDAEKMFYYLLSTVLRGEDKPGAALGKTVLGNEIFHKSLCVCSVEILGVGYISSSMGSGLVMELELGKLLKIFDLDPFYFCKLLRHVIFPDMPQSMKIKLLSIEEEILQHLAWAEDSAIFPHIEEVKPKIDADVFIVNSLPASVQNLYSSPVARRTPAPAMRSLPARADPRSPGVTTADDVAELAGQSSTENRKMGGNRYWVKKFIFRFARLADLRLVKLCKKLGKMHLRLKAMQTMSAVFNDHIGLLKNRKLDQIIICSIYAVCRINKEEIMFKDIIKSYRSLQNTEASTYLKVCINPATGESADIITFYNDMFLKELDTELKMISSKKGERDKGAKRKRPQGDHASSDSVAGGGEAELDDGELVLKRSRRME